jgi:hypothetical protein
MPTRGIALAQGDGGRAGVDQKVERPPLDAGFDLEVPLTICLQHQAPAGRDGRARLVDDPARRCLRGLSCIQRFVGDARDIAADQQHSDGEEQDLTHWQARW